MKSFFKKLAFVMALAMVVSLAAPAAKTAVAAEKELKIGYQNGMAITEVNLAKVGAQEDLRFLYAPANWKELGVKWTSSNENVVTVDNNGIVTAVAAGKADVSVAVGTESASVTVYVEDVQTYTATMGTADNRNITEWTLEEVGDEIDLAFYGIKDYSLDDIGNGTPRYFCEWTSTDDTVATVDKKGLVTAVAPGKAKITLVVWNLKLGVKHNVDACWITVPAEETPVVEEPKEQNIVADLNKTQNTIEITFETATDLVLDNVEMYRVFNADDDNNGDGIIDARDAFEPYQDFYVYAVNANKDKTVYTAVTFDDFVDGATYEVRVAGYEPEQFVASVGPVAKVVVWEKTPAFLASEEGDVDAVAATLAVTLYDAKGVDVTTRLVNGIANNDISNISYELTSDGNEYSLYDNEIMFYEKAVATVKAIFDDYDATAPVESTPIPVSPSPIKAYGVEEIVAWTIYNTDESSWNKIDWNGNLSKVVPANEDSYVIVTLIRDTRGNYFSTHLEGCEKKYKDANGVEHTVYHTEDSNAAFWINGAYVEYKAMSPDKMLVETDGTIQSYEKGTARFALYLYDYNKQTVDGFVKELYSQNLTVCHEMKLSGFNVNSWSDLNIMMNTEEENGVENAYADLYSTAWIDITLKDIHGGDAKKEHAEGANFAVSLVNDVNDSVLLDVAEYIQDELNKISNSDKPQNRGAWLHVNHFAGYTGNYVRLTITETNTGVKKNISLTLTKPAEYDGASAKVHTVSEFLEDMGIYENFEKFVANRNNFTVEQAITDAKNDESYKNNGYNLILAQVDKKNNEIGKDSNIYIATDKDVKNLTLGEVIGIASASGSAITTATVSALNQGDRVIVVTGPDGKIFNRENGEGFGIELRYAGVAQDPTWAHKTEYYQYGLVFRTTDADGKTSYAKNGKYTISIYTVEEDITDTTKAINFAESTGLKKTIIATVVNNNAKVEYAGRDAIRLEGNVNAVTNENILKAFNFKLDGVVWDETDAAGTWKLDPSDIVGFTTTKAASNNQIVINTVTFKVPIMGYAHDANCKDDDCRYGYYEYKCTVNKAITFE